MTSLHETLAHRLADAAKLVEYGWQERDEWNVRFTVLGTIAIISFVSWLFGPKSVKAPYAGYRSAWEPTFLLRMRFIAGARPIIMDGYNKVRLFLDLSRTSLMIYSSKTACSSFVVWTLTFSLSPTNMSMNSDSCLRASSVLSMRTLRYGYCFFSSNISDSSRTSWANTLQPI